MYCKTTALLVYLERALYGQLSPSLLSPLCGNSCTSVGLPTFDCLRLFEGDSDSTCDRDIYDHRVDLYFTNEL